MSFLPDSRLYVFSLGPVIDGLHPTRSYVDPGLSLLLFFLLRHASVLHPDLSAVPNL